MSSALRPRTLGLVGLVLALALALLIGPALHANATPAPGKKCTKAGKTYTVPGKGTLKCKKVNGKLVWTLKGGGGGGGDSQQCTPAAATGLERSSVVPFGTRAPAWLMSPTEHSYGSPEKIKAEGFTAINTSILIPYTSSGSLDLSRYGGSKEAWLCQIGNGIAALKAAGLVVIIEGELQQSDNPQGTEPGPVPTEARAAAAATVSSLIPDFAALLEKYKVEYWAPLGESDKWLGIDLTQQYYPQWAETAKATYGGTLFAQIFTGVPGQQAFGPLGITPDLSHLDALGVVFGDWSCSANSLQYTDDYVAAAREQGITKVFISELGGSSTPGDASEAEACMRQVVTRYGGVDNGVLFMDNPKSMPNAHIVENNWPEALLKDLMSRT